MLSFGKREFRIRAMGDSTKSPDKQGWISIGTEYHGPNGSYVSPELPLLSFWKTSRDGKTETAVWQELKKVEDISAVALTDVVYNYSSTQSDDGIWFENNVLREAKLVNRGQDVTDDDARLPTTEEVRARNRS